MLNSGQAVHLIFTIFVMDESCRLNYADCVPVLHSGQCFTGCKHHKR